MFIVDHVTSVAVITQMMLVAVITKMVSLRTWPLICEAVFSTTAVADAAATNLGNADGPVSPMQRSRRPSVAFGGANRGNPAFSRSGLSDSGLSGLLSLDHRRRSRRALDEPAGLSPTRIACAEPGHWPSGSEGLRLAGCVLGRVAQQETLCLAELP